MWNLPTFFNIQIEVSVAKHYSFSVQIYWGWTFSSLVCHNGKETNSTIMLDKVCVYLMYGHWINLTLHYLAQQILTANYYRQYRSPGQDWGRSAENTSLCLYLDDGGCDDDGCKANHREIWNKRFVKKILLLGCDTHRLVFCSILLGWYEKVRPTPQAQHWQLHMVSNYLITWKFLSPHPAHSVEHVHPPSKGNHMPKLPPLPSQHNPSPTSRDGLSGHAAGLKVRFTGHTIYNCLECV